MNTESGLISFGIAGFSDHQVIPLEEDITSIGLDSQHGNLYWTNAQKGIVSLTPINRLFEKHASKLLINKLTYPTEIMVSPKYR